MKRISTLAVAVVSTGLVTADLAAQGLGVGARVGFVGLGAEAAVALSPTVQARAGFGLLPIEASPVIDDIEVTLDLPESWYNIGVDVYLAGSLRIGGGVLFKPDDPTLEATPTTSVDIGGRPFSPQELGTLKGTLKSKTKAPYAILGLGRMTGPGFGLYADLGVAFLGEPEIELETEGGTFSDLTELQSRLAAQADEFERDAGSWLKLWPFLSVGLKFGIG